jgi:peptidoglycan/xylan/chitin deacetylase (PgdA/CDA1 family)
LLAVACGVHAEPRWLIRSLPGAYPEVVYFVPTDRRAIALTIDDGVDPQTTPAILDELRRHAATATFFLVSDSLAGHAALVERILAEGHEIGHHMTRDEVSILLSDAELTQAFERAADRLETLGGVEWFRPGFGLFDERMLELARGRGYRIALASVPPLDTVLADGARMADFIDWMIEPGSVVVLHDVGDRGRRTAQTLRLLLPRLRDRGYRVMSLGRLDALATPPGRR